MMKELTRLTDHTYVSVEHYSDLSQARRDFNDLISEKPWKHQVSTSAENRPTKEVIVKYVIDEMKERLFIVRNVVQMSLILVFAPIFCFFILPNVALEYLSMEKDQRSIGELFAVLNNDFSIDLLFSIFVSSIILFFMYMLVAVPLNTYKKLNYIGIHTHKDTETNRVEHTFYNHSLKNVERTEVIMKEINVEKACDIIESSCDVIAHTGKDLTTRTKIGK